MVSNLGNNLRQPGGSPLVCRVLARSLACGGVWCLRGPAAAPPRTINLFVHFDTVVDLAREPFPLGLLELGDHMWVRATRWNSSVVSSSATWLTETLAANPIAACTPPAACGRRPASGPRKEETPW